MAYKFLIVIILVFSVAKDSAAQTDPNFIALNNLNFDDYLNKPIDSLLIAIPIFLSTQAKIYGQLTNDTAKYLVINYPNKVQLVMRPERFQVMNPVDPGRVWDFSLFRQETAWYIELRYEGWAIKNTIAY